MGFLRTAASSEPPLAPSLALAGRRTNLAAAAPPPASGLSRRAMHSAKKPSMAASSMMPCVNRCLPQSSHVSCCTTSFEQNIIKNLILHACSCLELYMTHQKQVAETHTARSNIMPMMAGPFGAFSGCLSVSASAVHQDCRTWPLRSAWAPHFSTWKGGHLQGRSTYHIH